MNSNKIGFVGEKLSLTVLLSKFQNVKVKPRLKNNKIPDFVVNDDFWIDSKVRYGSLPNFNLDYENQFKYYMEHFDKGVVIYWRGYNKKTFVIAKEHNILLLSRFDLDSIVNTPLLRSDLFFISYPDTSFSGFSRSKL